MKKICLSFLSVAFSVGCMAQTVIEPSEVAVEGITVMDSDINAESLVINESNETQNYTWNREVIELTPTWWTAVCDRNLCHGPTVEQASFFLDAGESGTMDVHVYPNQTNGAAIVEVTVTNDNDLEDSASAMYYFNQALSTPEVLTNALKIYPNPVVSEFFIDGADDVQRVEIYNISGKLVKEVQSFGQGSVNVDNLGTGNYIVRMWDDSNNQISTNVLSVQ
jgi:hypothetical protein